MACGPFVGTAFFQLHINVIAIGSAWKLCHPIGNYRLRRLSFQSPQIQSSDAKLQEIRIGDSLSLLSDHIDHLIGVNL